MKRIKVGYLPLYIKLYDDNNPASRDPPVAYMKTLVSALEEKGLEVITADVCRIKPEFEAAVRMFNEENVDAVITQHLAYSPSLESIDALLQLKSDIVVMDTTPDYQLMAVAGQRNCKSANHGIHGVQDMCSMLKRNGRKYALCVGHVLDGVLDETVSACRAAAAAKAYRGAKVGFVGGSFHGMGDFLISDEEYKEKIGAEVVRFTPETAEK